MNVSHAEMFVPRSYATALDLEPQAAELSALFERHGGTFKRWRELEGDRHLALFPLLALLRVICGCKRDRAQRLSHRGTGLALQASKAFLAELLDVDPDTVNQAFKRGQELGWIERRRRPRSLANITRWRTPSTRLTSGTDRDGETREIFDTTGVIYLTPRGADLVDGLELGAGGKVVGDLCRLLARFFPIWTTRCASYPPNSDTLPSEVRRKDSKAVGGAPSGASVDNAGRDPPGAPVSTEKRRRYGGGAWLAGLASAHRLLSERRPRARSWPLEERRRFEARLAELRELLTAAVLRGERLAPTPRARW